MYIYIVASRIETRPFVEHLLLQLDGLSQVSQTALQILDAQVASATAIACSELPSHAAAKFSELCAEGASSASKLLRAIQTGHHSEEAGAALPEGRAATGLITAIGQDDPEYGDSHSGKHLQKLLCRFIDREAMHNLVEHFRAQGRSAEVKRLDELGDPSVNNHWMWRLSRQQGPILDDDLYITALRARLGAEQLEVDTVCGYCGSAFLDRFAIHPSCCAGGESTRGHYEVRDAMLGLAQCADAAAETEVVGLCPRAPELRPADILTSGAAAGWMSAIDVGIASPHARQAGTDCVQTMHNKKQDFYANHMADLEHQGIKYVPAVFSTYGRERPATSRCLEFMARRAARKQGLRDHYDILRRARGDIGLAIAARYARMIRACFPRSLQGSQALLHGEGGED